MSNVVDVLLSLLFSGVVACLVHEGGHYGAAKIFGHKLSFHFEWGKLFNVIPIPRGIWYMPDMESWKQKVVAGAGFGTELVIALIFALFLHFPWLLGVWVVHFVAYFFYAGEASDFKWFKK